MHYIQQNTDLEQRAKNFVGKTVRDTSGNVGIVINAWPVRGRIGLDVEQENGVVFITTNEYATIVSLGDYGPQYMKNPNNPGELEEE